MCTYRTILLLLVGHDTFILETKYIYIYIRVCVNGKAVPLQAWTGPEGSRKLKFPDFVTTAQDGGKVVSLTHWQH